MIFVKEINCVDQIDLELENFSSTPLIILKPSIFMLRKLKTRKETEMTNTVSFCFCYQEHSTAPVSVLDSLEPKLQLNGSQIL